MIGLGRLPTKHLFVILTVKSKLIETHRIPHAQQRDKEISGETCRQHLRDDVHVADEGRLENDWDIARVEKFDWVGGVLATVAHALDG